MTEEKRSEKPQSQSGKKAEEDLVRRFRDEMWRYQKSILMSGLESVSLWSGAIQNYVSQVDANIRSEKGEEAAGLVRSWTEPLRDFLEEVIEIPGKATDRFSREYRATASR